MTNHTKLLALEPCADGLAKLADHLAEACWIELLKEARASDRTPEERENLLTVEGLHGLIEGSEIAKTLGADMGVDRDVEAAAEELMYRSVPVRLRWMLAAERARATGRWALLHDAAGDGHRLFVDAAGDVAVADRSGPCPACTEDGPLVVQMGAELVARVRHGHLVADVPVTRPTRLSDSYVALTLGAACALAELQGHRLVLDAGGKTWVLA
jgi:hypothetical protein